MRFDNVLAVRVIVGSRLGNILQENVLNGIFISGHLTVSRQTKEVRLKVFQ